MALLEFPVVVCSSFQQVYGVDFYSESDPVQIQENFQLEIQYAYLGRTGRQVEEHLLLDFVEFDQLGKYMSLIDESAKVAVFFVDQTDERQ